MKRRAFSSYQKYPEIVKKRDNSPSNNEEMQEIKNKLNLVLERLSPEKKDSDLNTLKLLKNSGSNASISSQSVLLKKNSKFVNNMPENNIRTSFSRNNIQNMNISSTSFEYKNPLSNVKLPSITGDNMVKINLSVTNPNMSNTIKSPRVNNLKMSNVNENEEKYINSLREEFEKEERDLISKIEITNPTVNKVNDERKFESPTKNRLTFNNINSIKDESIAVKPKDKPRRSIKEIFSLVISSKDVIQKVEKKDKFSDIMSKLDLNDEKNQLKMNNEYNDESLLNNSLICSDDEVSDDGSIEKNENIENIIIPIRNNENHKSVKVINLPFIINVCEDETPENYSFQPFFFINEANKSPSPKKTEITKSSNKLIHMYLNFLK